jgi:hypothetical protein
LAQNAGSGEGGEDVPITLNKLLARLLVQAWHKRINFSLQAVLRNVSRMFIPDPRFLSLIKKHRILDPGSATKYYSIIY